MAASRWPNWPWITPFKKRICGSRGLAAIATLNLITEDYPELPEPHNNLAVLYAAQGQLDKAKSALETALRINPAYATAHENLGDVYAQLASQSYSRALQLQAGNTALPQKLALIRQALAPAKAP